jgi:AcrR family transcriptional regulator
MRKIDIRVIRTYEQLTSSLVSLLRSKTFEDLSVSEICDNADVHRATFYKHFNDKYEFLNFCFDNELSKIGFDVPQAEPTVESIKENFMYFIKATFEFVCSKKAIFSIMLSKKYSVTLGATFTAAVHNYCLEKIELIIPGTSKERAELFAAFYSNAFIGVVTHYAKNADSYPLEEVYDFLENRVDELCSSYVKQYLNK